jgi:hypothetical protein
MQHNKFISSNSMHFIWNVWLCEKQKNLKKIFPSFCKGAEVLFLNKTRKKYNIFFQNPDGERRGYLGDQSTEDKVILKCILKTLGMCNHIRGVYIYIYIMLRYVSTLASWKEFVGTLTQVSLDSFHVQVENCPFCKCYGQIICFGCFWVATQQLQCVTWNIHVTF